MMRLLFLVLALACLALASASAGAAGDTRRGAARVGTKRHPLIVHLNPAEPVDNWEGAEIAPEPFAPEGRNRLIVTVDPYHPPADELPGVAVFVRRPGCGEWMNAAQSLHRLGPGRYEVAVASGLRNMINRHFSWGPAEIAFPSRAGSRRYLHLTFQADPAR